MSYRILQGDCRETLATLPDESVHCAVTSPPYFGLRDYGVEGQIGLEQTPDEYVAQMVSVFREVRRVLRSDGTLWLNLGDSFKDKEVVGIPWRVAFALQADGWWLRQDIIWNKKNPMPESVRDRCTKAHEYIFLMSKSAKYFYDADAVMEQSVDFDGTAKRYAKPFFVGNKHESGGYSPTGARHTGGIKVFTGKRNRRSVWTVSTKPYSEAHFATFPPDLIEPCILAGCPEGGTVLDPFGGSGTTAMVALKHRRTAILCELNPEYIELIHKRCAGVQPRLIEAVA